jgi:phosphoglucosamine mutase
VARLFGTDGVRGLANGDLTAGLALDLSVAAAHVLADLGEFEGHRPLAVVGRDTRVSGQFLEAAVVAGLASAGVDVLLLGVLPTPGVACLTKALGADLGVVLSASHNPMPDNGIKFFARGGLKLDDPVEAAIEQFIEQGLVEEFARPTGADVGRVTVYPTAVEEYAAHLVRSIDHPLAGLTVVLDCAEGAAYDVGPRALEDAGAKVVAIHASPDGLNINDGCGSTHLDTVRAAVLEHGADVGFAVDSDADRCLAVDHEGTVVDGDQLLAILALSLKDAGRLAKDTVVATVMSNLGFVKAMRAAGIGVRQTKVGDRYVLQAMQVTGYNLGGEQSGHVILTDHATTGDGVLAALQVLERMVTTGQDLKSLASVVQRLPQTLVNVTDVDKSRVEDDGILAAAVAEEEAALGEGGRILLRSSGTEPIVRVMVEAATQQDADDIAQRLAAVVRMRLAL